MKHPPQPLPWVEMDSGAIVRRNSSTKMAVIFLIPTAVFKQFENRMSNWATPFFFGGVLWVNFVDRTEGSDFLKSLPSFGWFHPRPAVEKPNKPGEQGTLVGS